MNTFLGSSEAQGAQPSAEAVLRRAKKMTRNRAPQPTPVREYIAGYLVPKQSLMDTYSAQPLF